MANYETLKSAIQQVIKTNGNNEITGALLQQSLLAMINSLGSGYQFAGIAVPATNPGTPDGRVFYIASKNGTYANFNSNVINDEIAILKFDGAWTKENIDLSMIKNRLIKLKFMATSGSLENGEYGYRTDTKKIRYNDNGTVVDVPFYPGAIYTYNNELYVYNGDTLVMSFDISMVQDDYNKTENLSIHNRSAIIATRDNIDMYQSDVNSGIRLHIGTLVTSTTGKDDFTNTKRATTCYLRPPFYIKVAIGYKLRYICRYNYINGEISYKTGGDIFLSQKQEYGVRENDGYLYKIIINKNDDTQVISENELPTIIDTFNGRVDEEISNVNALKNVVDSLQIAVEKLTAQIKIESGGLETYSPGGVLALSQRARTVNYIPTPFAIELNSGFLTRVVNKYSRNTHQYVSTELIRVTQYSILNDDGYDYRIVFQKDDDTQTITDSELETIVKSYKDADKLQLEKTIDDASRRYPSIYVSGLNLSKYPNYASIISDYDAMVAQYPNFISKNTLGQTAQGTPLVEYVLTSGAYNIAGQRGTRDTQIAKKKMLLMTGVHGYEPGSVMSTLTMVREYIGGNSVLSKLRNFELHIVPCVNPDGYNAGTRYNANGVDINRNFNENWQLSGEGTAYYSGPSAASENETQIIQAWIDDNTDALFVIDFHQSSFNNEVACLGYTVLYTTPGEDAFKKRFLLSMRNIANLLIKERGVAYDSIFGYTYNEPVTMHGLSNGYIAKKGLPGGCLEVPENVASSGINSVKTIAVGADIIGNLLLGWYELYNIGNNE